MRLSFNIAGPCIPGRHYMLPPERRLGRVMELIEDGKYFTLTAGRQTGKTTCLRWLAKHYGQGSDFCAIWVDIQNAREQPDPAKAMPLILQDIERAVAKLDTVEQPSPETIEHWLRTPGSALQYMLSALAKSAQRPLVVLFDEADGLTGEAMVSFLTQLRQGYIARDDDPFPHSVALVGMRQVRDYALSSEERRTVGWLGTTSPFNITADALTLAAFGEADVHELLEQHTTATGQRFEPEAAAMIYELSQGHPWLTCALAEQIVDRDLRDRSVAIAPKHVEAAKETIIVEWRTHIDSLVARLREPRVRRIIDPMIAGDTLPADTLDDDVAYVVGLGLATVKNRRLEIANPIYREVIVRSLTYVSQLSMGQETAWYVSEDGALDMPKLMDGWQTFWREDGHLSADGFQYKESGPHLMLMAFLQRVVNGGGRIRREYALGKRALDLLIEWRGVRHAIEVKLRRDTETEERAYQQIADYLEALGLPEGWLILFDLRSTKPWAERISQKVVEHAGKRIHVVGC